jgi:hypothetical protein
MSDLALAMMICAYFFGAFGYAMAAKSTGWHLLFACISWPGILMVVLGMWVAERHESSEEAASQWLSEHRKEKEQGK